MDLEVKQIKVYTLIKETRERNCVVCYDNLYYFYQREMI